MADNTANTKIEYLLDGTAAFNEAFEILNTELNRRMKSAENGNEKSGIILGIPTIVMLSFTIELGIKTLLFKRDNEITKGHKLEKLFGELDEHRKNRIKKYTCQKSGKQEENFEEILENNGSTFIDWRYFFEKNNNVEYGFLAHLNKALQKEVRIENDNQKSDLY